MDSVTVLQRLGAALRAARHQRGLKQAELAVSASLPRLKIIQIERGDASVSIGAYANVAATLGMEFTLTPARRPTLDEVKAMLGDD